MDGFVRGASAGTLHTADGRVIAEIVDVQANVIVDVPRVEVPRLPPSMRGPSRAEAMRAVEPVQGRVPVLAKLALRLVLPRTVYTLLAWAHGQLTLERERSYRRAVIAAGRSWDRERTRSGTFASRSSARFERSVWSHFSGEPIPTRVRAWWWAQDAARPWLRVTRDLARMLVRPS